MRAIAVPMILLMLSASLAGCTGGDPDGNDESSIDMDILNQMIDDNLQDFINNTTITVVNNHYSNDSNEVTNHINSSSGDSTWKIMTGSSEGYSMASNITSENDFVLLVRDDFRLENDPNWGNNTNHSWNDVDLDGANICVGIGTIEEGMLVNWFSIFDAQFTSVPVADNAEATAKFIDGSCDAIEGTRGHMVAKKLQLDADGSMNGVGIWISEPMGQFGELYYSESRIHFSFEQEYGTLLSVPDVYAEISVEGTCVRNCSASWDLPWFSETFSFHQDWDYEMYSECEIPNYGFISENHANFMLPGLECTLTISLQAHVEYYDERYDYVWSDWGYHISWSETEVSMQE